MPKHVGFKNPNIVTPGGSIRDNPTGQMEHPTKRKIVRNKQVQIPQFGSDGFHERQSKPRASIHGSVRGRT